MRRYCRSLFLCRALGCLLGLLLSLVSLFEAQSKTVEKNLDSTVALARAHAGEGDARAVVEILGPLWDGGLVGGRRKFEVAVMLGEAWAGLGEHRKGLSMLAEDLFEAGESADLAALAVARGRVLFQSGRIDDALAVFERASEMGGDIISCALGLSGCLVEQGRLAEAFRVLEDAVGRVADDAFGLFSALAGVCLDWDDWVGADFWMRRTNPRTRGEIFIGDLNKARLLALEGRSDDAIAGFDALLNSGDRVPQEVRWGALSGLVRELMRSGRRNEAVQRIVSVFETKWAQQKAEIVFRIWRQFVVPFDALAEAELRRLKSTLPQGVAEWASLFIGQILEQQNKAAEAQGEWDFVLRHSPDHPAVARIWARRAESAMAGKKWDEAEDCLSRGIAVNGDPSFGGFLQMRLGDARYQRGDFAGAVKAFEAAWQSGSRWRIDGAFNAGISALRMGAYRKVEIWLERLKRNPSGRERFHNLALELGLARAQDGVLGARQEVEELLDESVGEADRSAISLVMAEGSVRRLLAGSLEASSNQVDPWRRRAAEELTMLERTKGVQSDFREYLRIVFEAASDDASHGQIMQLGESFLRGNPESALCGQVRLLMGRQLFRTLDYARAEEVFFSAAEASGEPWVRERALYLAGQSAVQLQDSDATGRALVHWDAVAQIGGAMKWKARYQQAALKCRMGDEREGVVLYEIILKAGLTVERDLLFGAHCGRADALLSLARRSRTDFEEAIAAYRTLAEVAKDAPRWRNQAIYKAAKALEESSPDEAEEALRSLVFGKDFKRDTEDFWIFRAGFDLARILEGRSRWKEAVAVYESLSSLGGSRGRDALLKANQLRLGHFLWKE